MSYPNVLDVRTRMYWVRVFEAHTYVNVYACTIRSIPINSTPYIEIIYSYAYYISYIYMVSINMHLVPGSIYQYNTYIPYSYN